MRNHGPRHLFTTTFMATSFSAALLGTVAGCKWEKQPGPYTSGDQPSTLTPTRRPEANQTTYTGPTSQPMDPSAPATMPSPAAIPSPSAPAPDSPAAVQSSPAAPQPASNAALVPAEPATLPTGGATPIPPADPRATVPAAGMMSRPMVVPATVPAETPKVMIGTLHGDVVGIGGETTGWRLVDDMNTAKSMEVDVSAVRDQARKLDGKHVRIVGVVTARQWPERRTVNVLSARQIEVAPTPSAVPK